MSLYVYVGRVKIKGNQLGSSWKPLDSDYNIINDKELVFSEKIVTARRHHGCRIGAIYDITFKEGDQYQLNGPSPVAYYSDKNTVVLWESMDHAVKKDFEAAKQLEKEGRNTEFEKWLEPLRTAYVSLPPPARAQLLAKIVRYIST
jgi:hypothetical protein